MPKLSSKQRRLNNKSKRMTAKSDKRGSSPSSSSIIDFVVKRTGAGSAPFEVRVPNDATVADLKMEIASVMMEQVDDATNELPPERQRLIFAGRMLNEPQVLLKDIPRIQKDTKNFLHLAPLPKGAQLTARNKTERPRRAASGASVARPNESDLRRLSQRDRQPRSFYPYSTTTTRTSRLANQRPGARATSEPSGGAATTSTRNQASRRNVEGVFSVAPNGIPAGGMAAIASMGQVLRAGVTAGTTTASGATESLISPQYLLEQQQLLLLERQRQEQQRQLLLNASFQPNPLLVQQLQEEQMAAAMGSVQQSVLHDTRVLLPLTRLLPANLHQLLIQVPTASDSPDQHNGLAATADETVALLEQLAHRSLSLSLSLRSLSEYMMLRRLQVSSALAARARATAAMETEAVAAAAAATQLQLQQQQEEEALLQQGVSRAAAIPDHAFSLNQHCLREQHQHCSQDEFSEEDEEDGYEDYEIVD